MEWSTEWHKTAKVRIQQVNYQVFDDGYSALFAFPYGHVLTHMDMCVVFCAGVGVRAICTHDR